jgi:hypothetical protein
LERGLVVNLATIPEVNTDIRLPNGNREGFLFGPIPASAEQIPIGRNTELVSYLLGETGYRIIQHGLSHEFIHGHYEFDIEDTYEIRHRLDRGSSVLQEAGFPKPTTFVAPQDRLSKAAFRAVLQRYQILSSGWYQLNRLPVSCWPQYLIKRQLNRAHWSIGNTKLLTHPGCLLSRLKERETMLQTVKAAINSRRITVLVNHWWEFYPDGVPDEGLIDVLHQISAYLSSTSEIRVVSFDGLLEDE